MAISQKKCTAAIKTEKLKVVKCNGTLHAGVCSKKDEHMLPGPTGFCANGRHEGAVVTGPKSGRPQPTCKWWKRCPCSCHTQLDQIYIISEQPRIIVDSSGYEPEVGDFVMPSPEERARLHALSNPAPVSAPVYVKSQAPDRVPDTVTRTYTPTPSGRSARGELETYVKEVCDAWLIDPKWFEGAACTPRLISEEIASERGIQPPSTGAVDAVFKRWVRLGFAQIASKPTRFVAYTPEGVRLGLDALKARAKRAEKSAPRERFVEGEK